MLFLGGAAKMKCPRFPGEVRDPANIGCFLIQGSSLAFPRRITVQCRQLTM